MCTSCNGSIGPHRSLAVVHFHVLIVTGPAIGVIQKDSLVVLLLGKAIRWHFQVNNHVPIEHFAPEVRVLVSHISKVCTNLLPVHIGLFLICLFKEVNVHVLTNELALLFRAGGDVTLDGAVMNSCILWGKARMHAKSISIVAARPTHPKMEAVSSWQQVEPPLKSTGWCPNDNNNVILHILVGPFDDTMGENNHGFLGDETLQQS